MQSSNYKMVGIDVSKLTLDVCFSNQDVRVYQNNNKGYKQIRSKLSTDSFCVMESTSSYGYSLAEYLVDNGIKVSIVNPLQIKNFARMRMTRTKTDKADARLIQDYAETIGDLPEYRPATEYLNDIKQLQTVLSQLIKQQTAYKNQLEAISHMGRPSKSAIRSINRMLRLVSKEKDRVMDQIDQLVQAEYPEAYEKAISVIGIGKRTASCLLAATAGFSKFEEAKQLSSYIGVSPRINESGSSVRIKSHITKIGMSKLRSLLYMCSHMARMHNKSCRELYERLIAKGKAKKVALLAVANKLIKQVFACVKNNELFCNNYKKSFGF